MLNIALIGMPSSGKTTLGRMLAKSLGRTFVDLDEEIVKTDGRSIPDIFAAEGEDGFRTKETAETQCFGKEGRQLISCGGGIVKKPENLRALHQNGIILFIDRPVDALAVGGGRPLSSSMDALRQMEAQRRPLYLAAADAVIPNNGTLDDALHAAMEALDEFLILNGPNLNIMRWSERAYPVSWIITPSWTMCRQAANSWALRPTAAKRTTRATSWTKFRPQRAGWTASC